TASARGRAGFIRYRPSIDVRQPLVVVGGAAAHEVEVGGLQLGGDGAGGPAADRAVVDLAHRRDLGGGAGHEDLVGDVEEVAGEALLDDLVAALAGQGDHRVARDAAQDRRAHRGR